MQKSEAKFNDLNLKRKRLVIIDKDHRFRNIFPLIISSSEKYNFLGAFESFETVAHKFKEIRPDIVLIGFELPGECEIEAVREIKKIYAQTNVIILSEYVNRHLVFKSLKAGASGFISKDNGYEDLLKNLDSIQRDEAPISGRVGKIILDYFNFNPNSPLGRRETEILKLIANGENYSQISEKLFISRETVKTHVRNIYAKLFVNKRADAIKKAQIQGLI